MPRKCPICNKAIPEAETPERFGPFCSKRCQQIDLGKWLTGSYAIPVIEEDDEDESPPPEDPIRH